jgi:hypothetical protein
MKTQQNQGESEDNRTCAEQDATTASAAFSRCCLALAAAPAPPFDVSQPDRSQTPFRPL